MKIQPHWIALWERMALWNGARILGNAEPTAWVESQVNDITVTRLQTVPNIEHDGVRYTHACVIKFSKGAAVNYLLGEFYDEGAQLPLD